MTRRVRWSRNALDDLKSVLDFLDFENPTAARRVSRALEQTAEALANFSTGRPGRWPDIYEKSVSNLPYVIAYELRPQGDEELVVIVRIIHTARNWPKGAWPQS